MGDQDRAHEKLLNTILEANKIQTQELKDYINSEIEELRNIIKKEQKERNELEIKYENLQNKYMLLEKKLRKNNIVIFGIENANENLLDSTINKLNEHLNLNIQPGDINNIFTIGKKQEKPIIVQFVSYLTKLDVLRNCKKLKGTKITISEELSVEEREKNKILRKHLIEARSKNLNAYIKNFKLYVSGEEYTPEQLLTETDSYAFGTQQENVLRKYSNHASATNIRKRSEEEQENIVELENPQPEAKKKKPTPLLLANIARSSARLVEKENSTKNSPSSQKQKIALSK